MFYSFAVPLSTATRCKKLGIGRPIRYKMRIAYNLRMVNHMISLPMIPASLPKTGLGLVALALAIGCGGGSVEDVPEPQKENPFIVDEFLDYELKVSTDLSRGVFISGRDLRGKKKEKKKGEAKIAENTKIYKADLSGTTTNPQKVTGADLGSEQQVALTGDGKWVGIVARQNGDKKLYIQSYVKSDQRVEITDHVAGNNDIVQIAFSTKSNPYALAYLTRSKETGGKAKVFVVAFTPSGDDISAAAITERFSMDAANATGIAFGEASGATNYELIVKNAATASSGEVTFTYSRFSYANINGATNTATATSDTKLTGLTRDFQPVQGNDVLMVQTLFKGEDPNKVTPIGDGLNKPKLDNFGDALSLNVAPGAAKSVIASVITNPIAISALYDKSAMVVLGEEAIDCQEIGRVNTTSLAFKEGGSFRRLYLVEDNGNFSIQIADHSCELLRQGKKINDRIFQKAELRKAADGTYHLFVQSSFFSDIELYRFTFKVSGDTLTATGFLNVSNNRKP